MKKIIALALAVCMLAALASCGAEPAQTADSASTGTTGPVTTTAGTGTETQTAATETVTTAATDPETPVTPPAETEPNRLLSEKFGAYLTLKYNKAYCDVTVSTEAGLGDDEDVTVTVSVKNGYTFLGFSQNKAIGNGGKAIEKTTHTFTLSEESTVWVNIGMTYCYHLNDGTDKTVSQTADVTFYKNPNSLAEKDCFTREGYMLVEYNTMPDGSGEGTSLGSRPYVGGRSAIDLYCIWAKENEASDFTYTVSGGKATVTGWKGTGETAVVPASIEGAPVVKIASEAFTDAEVKTVCLPKTVLIIEEYAFAYSALETLLFFDGVTSVDDSCVEGCENFANLRLNAALDPYFPTYLESNTKYDYLLFARDKKKMVYVSGSSGQHSVIAADIEEALDYEYTVVNLGTNANISGTFWMELLSSFMKEDDILLWGPEDGGYLYGKTTINNRFWRSLECNYDVFRFIDMRHYSGFFDSYAGRQTAQTRSSYDAFNVNVNNNGDRIDNRTSQVLNGNYSLSQFTNARDEALMREQLDKMTENGVIFWITQAPLVYEIAVTKNHHTAETLAAYANELVSRYGGTHISAGLDHVFENKYFADSEWHMTTEGARLNTAALIKDIKAALEKEG